MKTEITSYQVPLHACDRVVPHLVYTELGLARYHGDFYGLQQFCGESANVGHVKGLYFCDQMDMRLLIDCLGGVLRRQSARYL